MIGQVFGGAVLGALGYAKLPAKASVGPPLAQPQARFFIAGLHNALWLCGIALLTPAVLGAAILIRRSPKRPSRLRSADVVRRGFG